MPPLQQDKSDIIANVKAYQSCYKTFEIQLLAVNKDNSWYGLYVVARLSVNDKPEAHEIPFDMNSKLAIIRYVEKYDMKKFTRFIEGIGGVVEIPKWSIMLTELSSSSIVKQEKAGWSLWRLVDDTEGWPAIIFHAGGNQIQAVADIDELTKLMKKSKPVSFSSLEQMTQKQLNVQLSPSVGISVFVVAPIYIRLENAVLSDKGHLSAEVRIHSSFSPSLLSLNVVYETAGGAHVGNYSQDLGDGGIRDGEFVVYKVEDKSDKEEVNAARMVLSLGNWTTEEVITITKHNISTSSPPDTLLPVLKMFNGGRQLNEFLAGSAGKAREHQAAVAWLLSILGLKTILLSNLSTDLEMIYDDSKIKRGSADVLAFDPDTNKIMVIDATLWTPGTKLDEIRNTAEYIKEKTGIQVIPVVLSRLNLKSAKKQTEDDIVNVIDVDDVRSILALVEVGKVKEAKQAFLDMLEKRPEGLPVY